MTGGTRPVGSAALILLILGWVFVPFYLRSGVYTMPEFLERRYSSAARWYLAVISIIGYVESVSVGKTLAAKRRQRIDPNQELIGLGAANVASAVSGGFPVTGGFSRSVVNFDAGAVTPAASLFAAAGIALAALVLTPLLYYLPQATLAAIIIKAVAGLISMRPMIHAWRANRHDGIVAFVTFVLTLALAPDLELPRGGLVGSGETEPEAGPGGPGDAPAGARSRRSRGSRDRRRRG